MKNLRSLLFQHFQLAEGGFGNSRIHGIALEDACSLAAAEFAPQWESPKLLLRSQVQLDRLNNPAPSWYEADAFSLRSTAD